MNDTTNSNGQQIPLADGPRSLSISEAEIIARDCITEAIRDAIADGLADLLATLKSIDRKLDGPAETSSVDSPAPSWPVDAKLSSTTHRLVYQYFANNGNVPSTVLDIVEATAATENAARHAVQASPDSYAVVGRRGRANLYQCRLPLIPLSDAEQLWRTSNDKGGE